MKRELVMEAPEKIYVQLPSRNWIGRLWNETPIKEGDNPNWKNATNIEYTSTDAFIKKAEEFIYSALNDGIMGTANIEDFMRLFKKYMED